MKKGWKSVWAIALVCCLLMPSWPLAAAADTDAVEGKKGLDFSANTYIAGKFQQLFDLLVYSDTPYFTVFGSSSCGNTACVSCELTEVSKNHPTLKELGVEPTFKAYGSSAFARYVYALIFELQLSTVNIFGNDTTGLQRIGRAASKGTAISGSYDDLTVENLRAIFQKGEPGDFIQTRSLSGGNHAMILLKATEESVFVLHSLDYQASDLGLNRVVLSEISYETMVSKWNQVITLFRAEQDAYEAALGKGENLHLTCTYTDEGQNACVVCGKEVSPKVSSEGAGVYKATGNAVTYKGYYRSTGTGTGSYAEDTYAEAIGSVVNSTGVRFYLLRNGEYISSEDFTVDTAQTPSITAVSYPSGDLDRGLPFNLTGTVYIADGLAEVAGLILSEDGAIVQEKRINVTDRSVYIGDCDINSNLRFAQLPVGAYTYMLTAKGKNGRMSSFTSNFNIVNPSEKPTPDAPSAPQLSSKSDTAVTLEQKSGYEYRVGSGSWQTSPVFTGLSPATTYVFYQRIAATASSNASPASAGLSVTTEKSTPQAAPRPVLKSVSDSTVTLQTVAGCEYRMEGGSWQSSPEFTGLSPATSYTFYQRYAATSQSYAGASSGGLTVVTSKKATDAPEAPEAQEVYADCVVLKAVSGYEYRMEGGSWQSGVTFTGLSPATTYVFYQRRAATSTTLPSAESAGCRITTPKRSVSDPAAPVVQSKTSSSVTLVEIEGYEYRMEGGNWQTSPVFTGLSPATTYAFSQRIRETSDSLPSAESVQLQVTTEKNAGKTAPKPTVAAVTSTSVTLNEVSGCEYRVGNGAWQTSPLFEGLSPATSYVFYQRYAETSSAFAGGSSAGTSVTTDKKSGKTAPAPTLKSASADTVILNAYTGMEYRRAGGTWQSSATFTGLSPNTAYTFYQRYAETADSYAGAESPAFTATTSKQAGGTAAKPELVSVSDTTATVKAVSGVEFSMDGGSTWQTSGTFSGLISNTAYEIIARCAETATSFAGSASVPLSVRTDRSQVSAPSKPVLVSIKDKTVTLQAVEGMEYSVDGGGTWLKSPVITVYTYGTKQFICRWAQTDRAYASPASDWLIVEVNPTRLTSQTLKIDENTRTIGGVSAGVSCAKLLSLFEEKEFITPVTADGKSYEAGSPVSTGMILRLPGGEEYTLLVKGDTNGDGSVDIFDLAQIRNQILSGEALTGAALAAADVNEDGNVDIFDYHAVRRSILDGTTL